MVLRSHHVTHHLSGVICCISEKSSFFRIVWKFQFFYQAITLLQTQRKFSIL